MIQKELLSKIEALEKRIAILESLKLDNIGMFGRSYSQFGSTNSDFLIKTKGQVKIQYGSSFIDLIKNGKINVDASFIFKEDKVGSKDGIYLVGEDVWLVVSGELVNLKGEIGNTYVSFLTPQETTSELKYQALVNIGFLYSDLTKVDSSALKNGVIYIEDELKLYFIKNGELTEFKVEIPNPFTELFIIQKTDTKEGALVIKGTGIANSIKFNSMLIYEDNTFNLNIIKSNIPFVINVSGADRIYINTDMTSVTNTLVTTDINSAEYILNCAGYALYTVNGLSILEVDKVIERKGSSSDILLYPEYWLMRNRIIQGVEILDSVTTEEETKITQFEILINDTTPFIEGDLFYVYINSISTIDNDDLETTESSVSKVLLTLISKDDKILTVESNVELSQSEAKSIVGLFLFCVAAGNVIRIKNNNIDTVEYLKKETEVVETVHSRLGNIGELSLNMTNNSNDIPIEGYGVYSKQGFFESAGYTKDYDLPADDCSSRFASTEWIKNNVKSVTEIDFGMDSYSEISNITTYYNNKLADLVTLQADNTSQTYVGYRGTVTITKGATTYIYAIVSAPNKDNTMSHRSLNLSYTSSGVLLLSTYIIKDLIMVGYYYSIEKNKDGTPKNPTYYGTSEGAVSASKPYLWYTNDGENFELVNEYVDPIENRIYIASTGYSVTFNATDNTDRDDAPGGFIVYYSGGLLITKYGQSNWLPVKTGAGITLDISNITNILQNPDSVKVPDVKGYNYLWSIDTSADRTNIENWKLERSLSNSSEYVNFITNCDWGNSTLRPGYKIRTINSSNKIGPEPDSSVFISGEGTKDNWNNEIWRKSFLSVVLSDYLLANRKMYIDNIGWLLNYNGLATSIGYSGFWTARLSGLLSPSSDDPNNIGYTPIATLSSLSGWIFEDKYLVNFQFSWVKIGLKLPWVMAFNSSQEGDSIDPFEQKYFNIDYQDYTVVFKEVSRNAIHSF